MNTSRHCEAPVPWGGPKQSRTPAGQAAFALTLPSMESVYDVAGRRLRMWIVECVIGAMPRILKLADEDGCDVSLALRNVSTRVRHRGLEFREQLEESGPGLAS